MSDRAAVLRRSAETATGRSNGGEEEGVPPGDAGRGQALHIAQADASAGLPDHQIDDGISTAPAAGARERSKRAESGEHEPESEAHVCRVIRVIGLSNTDFLDSIYNSSRSTRLRLGMSPRARCRVRQAARSTPVRTPSLNCDRTRSPSRSVSGPGRRSALRRGSHRRCRGYASPQSPRAPRFPAAAPWRPDRNFQPPSGPQIYRAFRRRSRPPRRITTVRHRWRSWRLSKLERMLRSAYRALAACCAVECAVTRRPATILREWRPCRAPGV